MLRDFHYLDRYLNKLLGDVYAQPPDHGHTGMAMTVLDKWVKKIYGIYGVLDVGCGDTAFLKPAFEKIGLKYTGIALGTDNPDVQNMDYTFTSFEENSFDLIFARHALEHSPMPIITLMEWNRIGSHFLIIVNPNPDHYGWVGLNHYSVANKAQLKSWADSAGWSVIWEDDTEPTEIRLMCQKKEIVK